VDIAVRIHPTFFTGSKPFIYIIYILYLYGKQKLKPRFMSITQLAIGGLTPFTTLDFPDHLAAVVFCQGCPWRCGYCQNTHLLDFGVKPVLSWDEVEAFLQRRQGLLDAVVFSGGEPTLHLRKGLLEAVQCVRGMGFKIGLHTGGVNTKGLAKLLPYLDWVGFDIKAPFESYATITGVPNSGKPALESAKLLLQSGVAYEFRTTVHPHLLNESDLLELATLLAELGVQRYVLQDCRTRHCLDSSLQNLSFNEVLSNDELVQAIRDLIPCTFLR
jgi:pyruvate formate lyase activating enzyme